MRPGSPVVFVFIISLLVSAIFGMSAVSADEPAKILAMAKGGEEGRIGVIRGWLLSEPSFTGTPIAARDFGGVSSEDVMRMIRIYFPRTYEDLTLYDFILLASVDMSYFTDTHQKWMYDAMTEAGLGGMNTRSVQSMSTAWSAPWMNSIVSDAFPNDVPAVVSSDIYQWGGGSFPTGPIEVNDDEGIAPVVRPFKEQIERVFPTYRGVLTIPRPGSTIYTWVKSSIKSLGSPLPGYIGHLFEWTYGNATTFTAMDMVMEPFWKGDENPYSMDIFVNVVWRATGRVLPQDALRVHALRTLFRHYNWEKSSFVAMVEFTENFGANTRDIYSKLREIEARKADADSDYLEGDFEASYDGMGSVLEDLQELEAEAVKLKNSALAWVFLIEWLSVSATLLACGVVLWNLMIRRRMYREVAVTRFD